MPSAARTWAWVVVAAVLGAGVWAASGARRGGVVADPGPSAYARGRWSEAADVARERLRADPGDPGSVRLLARSTARLGRDASALALFARVPEPDRQAEDLYLLGLALGRSGKPAGARTAWESAIRLDPDHAETLDGLAQLAVQAHALDKAADLAARLAKRPGWEARGNRLLGVLRAEMNDQAGAAEALGAAVRLGKDPGEASPPTPGPFGKRLARALLQTGRPAEAREALRRVLATGPDREASWLLSRACLQSGATAEAAAALDDSGTYGAEHPLDFEPSPYAGEARCAACHEPIHKSSLATRHAASFHRGDALKALPKTPGPVPDPGDPKAAHEVKAEGDRVVVETKADAEVYRLVVDYAFGTADRYVTLVGRDADGTRRAARISYHRDGGEVRWDVSSGDQVEPSATSGVRGKPVDAPFGIVRCLACHTTNVRFGAERTGPESADRGIGCERCHGPGAAHVAAIASGFTDMAIVNPARAPEATSERLCASCHNLNDQVFEETTPRDDPGWVRSPAKTLTWSRCYTQSLGALRCLICHDAHKPSEAAPAFYEAKCLGCHDSGKTAASAKTACPVNPRSGCLDCHMTKVPNPLLHTSLTDHYIRVRKAD